jgi:hypothetical protein
LEIEAAKVGIKINEQKTKYIIAARNDWATIGEKHFKVVKEFVYLGSLMTPTNDVSLEIQRRSQKKSVGASSDCPNICSRATFHARQNSPFTKPSFAQSCSTAVSRGC